MRAEDSNGFSGLNQQGLIILELAERAHNGVERWPIAGGASGSTVDDQLIGLFGDLGIEVVHQHPERTFLVPAFAGNLAAPRRPNNRRMITHHSYRTVKTVENQSLEIT